MPTLHTIDSIAREASVTPDGLRRRMRARGVTGTKHGSLLIFSGHERRKLLRDIPRGRPRKRA